MTDDIFCIFQYNPVAPFAPFLFSCAFRDSFTSCHLFHLILCLVSFPMAMMERQYMFLLFDCEPMGYVVLRFSTSVLFASVQGASMTRSARGLAVRT